MRLVVSLLPAPLIFVTRLAGPLVSDVRLVLPAPSAG